MTTRFHLYFPTGTEHLLEEAKEQIPNLSDFLIQALKVRLSAGVLMPAEQALKNRLAELRRTNKEQFGDIARLFAAKSPGPAKILEEL